MARARKPSALLTAARGASVSRADLFRTLSRVLENVLLFLFWLCRARETCLRRLGGQGFFLFSWLKQLGNQSRPAGLMGCAHATARIAVKVFVEENMIAEVRVSRKLGMILEDRSLAVLPFEEHLGQA